MSGATWGGYSRLDIDGSKICFTRFEDKSVVRLTDGSEEAICGMLDHDKALVDEGLVIPRAKIILQPTPEELDILFPFIGFIESPADTFTPTDEITDLPLAVKLDRAADSGNADDLGNGYVNTATFRAQKGVRPMTLELDVVFDQILSLAAAAFAGAALTNTSPYPFHRSVLTLEGSARSYRSSMFVVNNNLIWEHNNARVPERFEFGKNGREFHFGVNTPYTSSETDLLSNPLGTADGAAGSWVFTRGGQSTQFAFTNLKVPELTPPSVSKEETRLNTFYKAYANGATKPVVVTHDATA